MVTPLVSIVIPCFRQGHFLAGAIDAALAQSYPAIEVVVVNDGSDDQTDEVAREYSDRIRYIFQMNQGLAAARNAGLALASGQYVLFLDADDLIPRDAVRWHVETLGGRDDQISVIGHTAFHVDPSGDPQHTLVPAPGAIAHRFFRENVGPPHTVMVPRAALAAINGFDRRPTGCEDWDCWIRLLLSGCDAVATNRIGAYYRLSPTSMSRNIRLMEEGMIQVRLRTLQAVANQPHRLRELGIIPESLGRELRLKLYLLLFDRAYDRREEGRHWGAFRDYLSILRLGELSAFSGICKLVLHRLARLVKPKR
jgi:glycosyltransferase involved in cell wall biosynthesis